MTTIDWKGSARTLRAIREERGEEIRGFVIMITGALSADAEQSDRMASSLRANLDQCLTDVEFMFGGELELTGAVMRVETCTAYVAEDLPNA